MVEKESGNLKNLDADRNASVDADFEVEDVARWDRGRRRRDENSSSTSPKR